MAKQKSTSKPASAVSEKPTANPVPEREMFRYVDGVEIALTALEDVQASVEAIEETLDLFKKGGDEILYKASVILEPAYQKLAAVISNEFPDLKGIRKHLVEKGLGNEIRG